MNTLKLTAVGTSTGVILPKEMLHRLKVKKGDTLYAIETPEGYLLTPYGPAVEEHLASRRTCRRGDGPFRAGTFRAGAGCAGAQ